MSDEITKPHFLRRNDKPQQITATHLITPGKVKGKWTPGIPVIIVRDHPGIEVPAPQQSGTGTTQQEAMKKPVQRDYTKGETK